MKDDKYHKDLEHKGEEDIDIGLDNNMELQSNLEAIQEAEANANANANAEAEAEAESEAEAEAYADACIHTEAEAESEADADANADANTTSNSSANNDNQSNANNNNNIGQINVTTPINIYITCGCCGKKHKYTVDGTNECINDDEDNDE